MKTKSTSRVFFFIFAGAVLAGALLLLAPTNARGFKAEMSPGSPVVLSSPETCPPANCTAGRDVGRDFFEGVIQRLSDVPMSDFAVDALMAWEPYENTSACWNPLATTRNKPGSCCFNSVCVRHYLDQTMGMEATAETLALSYYTHIRAMLRLETFDRDGLRSDLGTWGTCHGSSCDSLLNTWQSLWDDAQGTSGTVIVVEDPDIRPAYNGMCGSAWYRFGNNRGHYAYLTLNTDNPAYSTNTATWTPNLPSAGVYKVEAYIAHHTSIDWQCPSRHISWDTGDARYTIYHANGSTTVSGNQGPLDNQWLDLGTYTFNAGTGGKVALTDLNGETHLSHTVSFSAMRFTLISTEPPPPSNDVVVEDPGIHPAYGNGMCDSAWYRFSNSRGHYAYLTLNTNDPNQSTNWAEWYPSLPRDALYKVEAYIAHHNPIDWQCPSKHISWDTSDARYTVHYADGQATVSRNQGPLDNQWLTLGTWYFDADAGSWVKLTDLNGEANLSHTVSFSALRFVFQNDTVSPWGEITSPRGAPTWSGGPFTFAANAGDNPNGSGVKHVYFWVRYAETPGARAAWHDAGDDSDAPYNVAWTPPADLRSQLVEVGIHVQDRYGNYCINPSPAHDYTCNEPESKEIFFYKETGVSENWIDADMRAYLNQRSLPDGDIKCAAASAAMFLAMSGEISGDYNTLASTANTFHTLIPDGVPTADNVASVLNRYYGMDVTVKSYRFELWKDTFWNDVRAAIDAGAPVILLSKRFTGDGHHVVIVGYRDKDGEREFIVYDPYGRWQGTQGLYDRNSYTAGNDHGDENDSFKGRWVWYSLDSLWAGWGSRSRPYAIFPSYVIRQNSVVSSVETDTPISQPDLVSDEEADIGVYQGVSIEYEIFLPLTTRR